MFGKEKRVILKIFTFLITAILVACSTGEKTGKEDLQVQKIFIQQVNLKLDEIHCWLNVMPGGGSRFNVSGRLVLLPSTKYDLRSTDLEKVSVAQGGKEIYLIKPTVTVLSQNNEAKKVAFSTIRGLELSPELNAEKTITLKLIFVDGSDHFSYEIENVKIEKAY